MIKVYWITEMGFSGVVPRSHKNMRTEFAWMSATESSHLSIIDLCKEDSKLGELGIIIIPKDLHKYEHLDIVSALKNRFTKYAFMQEGPIWLYQDMDIPIMFKFYEIMLNSDFGLAHNSRDARYYRGLLDKKIYVNKTLMIEDSIEDLPNNQKKRSGTIIGGNFVSWYRGFDSFVVASSMPGNIYVPSMGRKSDWEDFVKGLNHLPYMEWTDWIRTLNKFKFAIHLMDTPAAGTFSLNCAYLGIPCIGSKFVDTQRECFEELAIDPQDIGSAKNLYKKLYEDENYYNKISNLAKERYSEKFSESIYLKSWNLILEDNLKPYV